MLESKLTSKARRTLTVMRDVLNALDAGTTEEAGAAESVLSYLIATGQIKKKEVIFEGAIVWKLEVLEVR